MGADVGDMEREREEEGRRVQGGKVGSSWFGYSVFGGKGGFIYIILMIYYFDYILF